MVKILLKRRINQLSKAAEKRSLYDSILDADLKETGLKVIIYLESRRGDDGWTPAISIADICKRIDKGKTAVNDAINSLRKEGLILDSKKPFGGASRYQLKKY